MYEMPEAQTTDQKWAVGSTLESMIASGKISVSAVASMIGKCQQVWTVRNGIRLTTYDSDKFGLGLCWDAHESWLKDLHAGHFDEAFMRDHLNDELAKGRITSREWDVQYADFLARREKHV